MSRLETLIEQTTFLLEKQEEVKHECEQLFRDFLSFLQEKINDFNSESEQSQGLEKVYDMVSGHAQKITDEAQEDIDFLQEQLDALHEIAQIEDAARSKELLNALIDDSEELPDTEEFKENVLLESVDAKRSLLAMLDDVKDALREGDIKEVELLLEAMLQDQEGTEDEYHDEECQDEDSDGCSSGGCGTCSTGCGPSDEGSDVFSFMSQYDRDLAEDELLTEEELEDDSAVEKKRKPKNSLQEN